MSVYKKFIVLAIISSFFVTLVGCANGPLRRMFRGAPCNTCQPPAAQPSFSPGCTNCQTGVGYSANYGGSGVGNSYYDASNVGGATINPSFGDAYSNGSLGGTIVPPITGDPLPGPYSGN